MKHFCSIRDPTMENNVAKSASVFQPLILIGKCVCFFPFGEEMRVGWFSWKLLHVYFLAVTSALLFAVYTSYCISKGVAFNKICAIPLSAIFIYFNLFYVVVVFFVNMSVCCSAICFTIVARKWPALMNHWRISEVPSISRDVLRKLKRQRNKIVAVYMTLVGILIVFDLYNHLYGYKGGSMENYVRGYYFYVFEYVPYNSMISAVLFVHRILAFVTRVFTDIFIITLSTSMSFQFKEFNRRFYSHQHMIQNFSAKVTQTNFLYSYCRSFKWEKIREDYIKLCQLCCHVDDILSNVIIISYVMNVSNILHFVYTSLKTTMNMEHRIFFSLASGMVVVRLIAITLHASSINEESRRPIDLLISVPSEVYNKEIDRWLYYLLFDTANLTGKRSFNINRRLILNITAAIATYELILLQFNPAVR